MKRLLFALTTLIAVVSAGAAEQTLRILAIGNSFSQDAVNQYLYEIGKAAGYELVIGNLYIGGCSLERHWKNAESGEEAYSYEKQVNGKWTFNKHNLEYGLLDEPWDVITVQQVSNLAGLPDTYEPYLTNLLKYVKSYAPKKAKIYFQQTWAYPPHTLHGGFYGYGGSTERMYDAIVNTVRNACRKHKIGVIPAGTAIQNGRTSLIGYNFTSDGSHLSHSIGRYTNACTWFETLTGQDVTNNGYKPEGITREFARLCRIAAHHAVASPWNVTPFTGHDCLEASPLAHISRDPGQCGIFHKWGFIGDSLSSGEFEYIKKDGSHFYYDCYEYSWGQRMCAYMGVKGDNYSTGGETAKGWIEHFWDSHNNKLNNCAKDDPKHVYVMALCVNDKSRHARKLKGYEDYTLGNVATDVDTADYTKNAQTFAGCYAGIIQRVRSIEPDCRIFVVTPPTASDDMLPYVEVIRQMQKLFPQIHVIDLQKYGTAIFDKNGFWGRKHYQVGHLNAAGYDDTAAMMLTYIDWIIKRNYQDFQNVGWIGTGKWPEK